MKKPRSAAPRAYASEDKQHRREVILQAARELLGGHQELPAASDIAARAGLAKGTVYLYFESREEIFAALAVEGWCEILDDFELTLRLATGRAVKQGAFWSTFAQHFEARPELLRLDAPGTIFLDGGANADTMHQFKQPLVDRLAQCALALEEKLKLPRGRGTQLLMRSLAMTRGIWQQFSQPDPRRSGLAAPPDFATELAEALREYWRGAVGRKP